MNRVILKRTILFIFLALFLFALGVLITLNWRLIRGRIPEIVGYFFMFLKIIDWLKVKFPKLYWFLIEVKLLFSNTQVRWRASADFSFTIDPRQDITEYIWREYLSKKKRAKLILSQNNRLVARVGGLETEVTFNYIDETPTVHIEILEYHAPYLNTSTVIDETIVPLFENVSKTLGVLKNEVYSLEVFFDNKKNPFLGMYAKEAKLHDLTTFQCVLKPKYDGSTTNGMVQIDKERVEVITPTISMFSNLVRRYLSVSGV